MKMLSLERSLLVILTTLLLFACSRSWPEQSSGDSGNPGSPSPAAAAPCQMIRHDSGETQICGQPQRIVALDPHALDLLLALGVQPLGYAEEARARIGPAVIGGPIAQIQYLGDRITQPPTNVGSRTEPSLEAIARLKPDLIFGENFSQLSYARLTKIAPTLFLSGSEADAWQRNLQTLAQALGKTSEAKAALEHYQQHLSAARAKLQAANLPNRVLLLGLSGSSNIEIFSVQTFPGKILQGLGFQLVLPAEFQAGETYQSVSVEAMPSLDTDQIIVMASGRNSVETARIQWQQNPILRSLTASQANQVHFVDYHLWNRIRGPLAAELVINQILQLLLDPPRQN